jgi:Tfp pilus assembly PilM family ATPase
METLTRPLRAGGTGGLWRSGTRSLVGIEADSSVLNLAWTRAGHGPDGWSFARIEPIPPESASPRKERRSPRDAARKAGVRRGPAVCAISSPAIDVLLIELRASEPEHLDALVVSHLQKQLGKNIDQAVIDYTILPPQVSRRQEESATVLAFSAPREVVLPAIRAIEEIGLDLIRMITPAHAVAPWVAGMTPEARRLVICTATEGTSVSVIQHGHVLVEQMLPWGVRGLAARLASDLDLDERRCMALLTTDIAPTAEPEGIEPQGPESSEEIIRSLLAPSFRDLAHEASTCLDYCDAALKHAPASDLILTGPLARNRGLRRVLERELAIPVRGLLDCVDPRRIDRGTIESPFATAACCALWSEGSAL